MTTINATKGEFVNLINGLFAVSELKGKDFSLTVSENIKSIIVIHNYNSRNKAKYYFI